jgi:Na+/proline symporter
MHFSGIDALVVAVFFAILLAIPLWTSRRRASGEADFFHSGRSMPWWLIGISMVAAMTSTNSANLFTQMIREDGLAGNWAWWAFLPGGVLTVFVYAKLWHRSGATTDIAFYELRYSGRPAAFPHVDPKYVGDDMAYPAMIKFVPAGWLGVVAASLMGALFSTIAAQLSMGANYVVHDVWVRFVRPQAGARERIRVARWTSVALMAAGSLMAPLLADAKAGFDLMLMVGAGTGAVFLLRWFWMRINAWSEIVGIVAALLAAVVLELVVPNCGGPALASWQKILVGAGVTTVAWLVATFVTKPEPPEVQARFKALVRADGRDAGLGVLWTFLFSTAIFASMWLVSVAIGRW